MRNASFQNANFPRLNSKTSAFKAAICPKNRLKHAKSAILAKTAEKIGTYTHLFILTKKPES